MTSVLFVRRVSQSAATTHRWPRAPRVQSSLLNPWSVHAPTTRSFLCTQPHKTSTLSLTLSLVGTKPSKLLSSSSSRLSHSFSSASRSSSSLLRSFSRPFTLFPKLAMASPVHPGHLHKCTDATLTPVKTTIHFSITDKVGALDECLAAIKAMHISLTRIESRPSKTADWDYDFFVDFDAANSEQVAQVAKTLESLAKQVHVVGTGGVPDAKASADLPEPTPWFPRKMVDLDTFADKVLEMGEELDADHPGAKDAVYRARRCDITNIAKTYKTGQPIPRVEYTDVEIQTWNAVFNKLTTMFPTHACREHQYVFPLLVQNCGYRLGSIPQLDGVSKFLKDCTGFTLRPVMGLLTSRDFLNGLAFRVFHSTQYIRHHSRPLYTPEPDVCHELLGHVPLFANPDFADFSQEIGLASLGASDSDIERLATIYWFTVEFGICRQGDQLRAYGAGLLSSFGELEYCLSDKPEIRPFEPAKVALQKYPITEYQPVYFVAESFKDAQMRVREFANTCKRPFSVRYNAYTESIEILDSKEKVLRYAQSIKTDMLTLVDALEKLS